MGGGGGGTAGRTGDSAIAVAGCRAEAVGVHNGCRARDGRCRWRWRWPWTSPFYSESCCILACPFPAGLPDELPLLLGGKLVGMVRDDEKHSFIMYGNLPSGKIEFLLRW